MRLVTVEKDGAQLIGAWEGDDVTVIDVADMRSLFEMEGPAQKVAAERLTSSRFPLSSAKLLAPIRPKKFFHTAGNYAEHAHEGDRANWGHAIKPWIVFFQNVDAITNPDDPVVYPEHLTKELDYELELSVVIGKAGKHFSVDEAESYIGGYVIFNDITARDIQRREMESANFCFSKSIDTFCPLGPCIVTPDEIADPYNLDLELRGQRREASDLQFEPHVCDAAAADFKILGPWLFGWRHHHHRHGVRCGCVQRRSGCLVSQAR